MTEISSRDESDSAKLARLTTRVEQLEAGPDRLAGAPFEEVAPRKVDLKPLKALLARRKELLRGLDTYLNQFADAYARLVATNGEIVPMVGKQFRGDVGGMAERSLILGRLGEMKIVDDRRMDRRSKPTDPLESLAAIHDQIIAAGPACGPLPERREPATRLTRVAPGPGTHVQLEPPPAANPGAPHDFPDLKD